ncbi:MAG TPA: hypothetical protein DDW52_29195, partial [Planctomycetaceae bacterium]|nr:hypothetical protein [Planctomycetaceae bacterium]
MQSSNEVWQAITSAGLGTADDCRRWAAEVAGTLQPEHLANGTRTLEALVIRGHLTEFQATALRDGGDDLRIGNWVLKRPAGGGVWDDWFEASNQTRSAWIRIVNPQQLDRLRLYRPSVPRAQKLAGLDLPGCLQIGGIEAADGRLLTAVAPPGEGLWLSQYVGQNSGETKPFDGLAILWSQIVECVCQLHQNAIVHGALAPDRVWIESGRPILVTDPLCERSAMPSSSASGLFRRELPGLLPEHFIAPEFLAPDPSPSFAADVFSLGCIGWWLLTGQPPAKAGSSEQVMAAQAKPLLAEADVSLSGGPDVSKAVKSVLLHAMSRNLSGRFANALQLRTALTAALDFSDSADVVPQRESARASMAPLKEQTAASKTQQAIEQPKEKTGRQTQQHPKSKPPQTPPLKTPSSAATAPPVREQGAAAQNASPNDAPTQGAISKSPSRENAQQQNQRKSPGTAQSQKKKASALAEEPSKQNQRNTSGPKATPKQVVASKDQEKAAEPTPALQPPKSEGIGQEPGAASDATDTTRKTADGTSQRPPRELSSAPKPEKAEPTAAATNRSSAKSAKNPTKKGSRKSGNRLLVPIMGGCGFLIVMLAVLKLSGALESSGSRSESQQRTAPYQPNTNDNKPDSGRSVPQSTKYTVVSDDQRLWLPPTERTIPIPTDLLPPGAQVLLSVRTGWLADPGEYLAASLTNAADALATIIANQAGVELDELAQVTIALYPPDESGKEPKMALRVLLKRPMVASQLSTIWEAPPAKLDGTDVFASDELLYLLDPEADREAVRQFACGPVDLMREAIELEGEAGPMTPPVEQLWRLSDATTDISLLAAPQFFFAGGRWLVQQLPTRLADELEKLLATDRRSLLFQSRWEPTWYGELALTGRDQSDAAGITQQLRERLAGWPGQVEAWFADQAPHAAWRAIALRLPQMLRTL